MESNTPIQTPVSQPIIPSIPEQPIASKSKLSKWFLVVIIVLILLIVGSISAFILIKNSQKTAKVMPITTPIITITPTITPIPIVDTQTMTSSSGAWLTSIIIATPSGWISLNCDGSSLAFNPKGGVDDCGTEPNAFAFIIYKSNTYKYEAYKKDSYAVISNLKENITIAGKKASQFDIKYLEGPPAGDYKETVLFLEDGTYINILLNHLDSLSVYNQFINNLKFKQ